MATNFWDSFSQWGPGLVQAGAGWYTNKQAQDEAKKRAAAIGGDATNQGLNAAQQAELAQVGNVDPAQLFNQQQGLMAPVKEKGQADLMRDLYKKGMLGLANDQQAASGTPGNAGPTWQNQPGQRANPLAAAYFAAQAGADQKAAYDAIQRASDLRTAGVNRVSALGGARSTAMKNAADALPARTASPLQGMLGGVMGLLGNKGAVDAIGNLFKSNPVQVRGGQLTEGTPEWAQGVSGPTQVFGELTGQPDWAAPQANFWDIGGLTDTPDWASGGWDIGDVYGGGSSVGDWW